MEMQARIKNYWEGEATRYSEGIWREINNFKRQAWIDLIEEYRPAGNSLKVLDIGTGPGFFTMIITGMGHQVTAIDCTDNMLAEAKSNLEKVGLEAEFHRMDSHQLSFEDQTFDLIVSRNVTWILNDPEVAYREWYRVLKPKGRILIFDANWNLRLNNPQKQKEYEECQEVAKKLGIHRQGHVDPEEGDRIAKELFFSTRLRPQWDTNALLELGFKKIILDLNIMNRVWDEEEKVLYRSTPMFMIGAEK